MSGKLIEFNGIDSSGKKTQTDLLFNKLLLKHKVAIFDYPDYKSIIGNIIQKYLLGEYGDINNIPPEIVSLLFSIDRVKDKELIDNYIKKDYIVICNRYTYSNLYNAAKLNDIKKQDKFINYIETIEFDYLKLKKPDIVLFLDVDINTSQQRIYDRAKDKNIKVDEYEKDKIFLTNVRNLYLRIAKEKNWIIIDEMKNNKQMGINEIHNIIYNKLKLK